MQAMATTATTQGNPGRPLVTPERALGATAADAGGSPTDNGHREPEPGGPNAGADTGSTVSQQLRQLRRVVEFDHPRRFQKIETDLRWVIMLTSAQLVAIVGGAIAMFALN